ncbi:MAG TPA: response regulator [Vicinamibacteria bacterium]|jgi:FixJ family two-component response regulator
MSQTSDRIDEEPLVCVVDDDRLVRRAVHRQLRLAGYDVLAFDSSQAFLSFSLPHRPACLVVDVRLPGISGIELYERIKENAIPPQVVFLTAYGEVELATRAMKDGAVDFLEKPVRRHALLAAVETALGRSRRALNEWRRHQSLALRYDSLTPRERQVMDYVVTGRLNKETALDLGISEATIKVHRSRVMQKMGADSVSALTLMALSLGRVESSQP